ncbi:MAG: tRNA preQ1(34) S-adenosylmethionine ribosyltransferase-isomerase QueA [Pseudomonadota bacterium]
MQLKDFEYDLPERLIAQQPPAERTAARLLQVTEEGLQHGQITDLLHLLQPGDLLVVNNTSVIKARLHAVKDSGGAAEVLVERILDETTALCQVRVSKALQSGRTLLLGDETLVCRGREAQYYRLEFPRPVLAFLQDHGHVPLPPYIKRQDGPLDNERYQTVYGQVPGAVAAPTAGLHFSQSLLDQLQARGVALAALTLHVGAGTFQPVRGALEDHVMHQEWYEISATTAAQITRTTQNGGRIVAVGTTVARTLESAALEHLPIRAGSGFTGLFIKPGFRFKIVDVLITNFHLPGSTLMMLVSAFAGYTRIMSAYRQAVDREYRFFSYGDAMYLQRNDLADQPGERDV